MPRTNLCKPLPENLEAKEKAHALYLGMAIPKTAEIARRVGVHRKTVGVWASKEGWLEERDKLVREKRLKIQELLGSPIDRTVESLAICSDIKDALKQTAKHQKRTGVQSPKGLRETIAVLKEIAKLEKELQDQAKDWANYFH